MSIVSLSSWMFYSVVVGLLVAAAARVLDFGLGRVGVPTRWIWMGALLGTTVLVSMALFPRDVGTMPGRALTPARSVEADAFRGPNGEIHGGGPAGARVVIGIAADFGVRAIAKTSRGLSEMAVRVGETLPSGRAADRWALWLWCASSLGVFLILQGSGARFRRSRSAWSTGTVRGVRVRVSDRLGPAVAGVVRPEIILPRWALHLSEDELDLVLAHEAEHVRARDPFLLALGLVPLVLFPWSPGLWIQFHNLHGAVEVDCDRRVLRRGATPRRYAELLIRVRTRAHRFLSCAPTIASPPSLLQRRLQAMRTRSTKSALSGALASAAAALAILLVACGTDTPVRSPINAADPTPEAEPPRSSDRGAWDAASAEAPGETSAPPPAEDVREPEAPEALGGAPDGLSAGAAPTPERSGEDEAAPRVLVRDAPTGDRIRIFLRPLGGGEGEGSSPLVIVDGVIVGRGPAALEIGDSLAPEDIESIEVIKGQAAARLYGPRAATGVISIRTHAGSTGN